MQLTVRNRLPDSPGIEMHVSFTSGLNPRQYEKFQGISLAMCGMVVFSGVWLLTDLVPR